METAQYKFVIYLFIYQLQFSETHCKGIFDTVALLAELVA